MTEFLHVASFWCLTLVVVLLLLPLEWAYPRLDDRGRIRGRVAAIAAISIISLVATLFFYFFLQSPFVRWTVELKLFDLASVAIPDWQLVILCVLILDLLSYIIHVISHRIAVLWRIHSIHHSDTHVTAVTGFLHHPIEVLLTALWLLFFVVVLGIPVLVYFMYGLLISIHNAVSHANMRLPKQLDRTLRLVFVTPDVHRVHHSIDMREGNSNFGMLLTIWDRFFGTYIEHPSAEPEKFEMGLPKEVRPKVFSVKELLLHPFRGKN